MANVRLLWDMVSDRADYSNGGWVPTLPLINVTTNDVQQVARSASAAPADTQFRADLGGVEAINAFWLRGSLSDAARIRFAVSNTASGGPYLIDSGWMDALHRADDWGNKPWGAFSWGGAVDKAAYPAGPEVYWEAAAGVVYGRYLWCWIDDASNPDGFVDIGRFGAGQAWSPPDNMSYGASIDWTPMSKPRRTDGGKRLAPLRPQYREMSLTFEMVPVSVANTTLAAINHVVGVTRPMLVVYDPASDPSFRYRRLVYGSLTKPGRIIETHPDACTWSMSIEEDI